VLYLEDAQNLSGEILRECLPGCVSGWGESLSAAAAVRGDFCAPLPAENRGGHCLRTTYRQKQRTKGNCGACLPVSWL